MARRAVVLFVGLFTTLLGLGVLPSPASATLDGSSCPRGTAYVQLGDNTTSASTPLVQGTYPLAGGDISVRVVSNTNARVFAIDTDLRIFSVRMIGTRANNTALRNVLVYEFANPGVAQTSSLTIDTSSGFNRIKGIGICYGGRVAYGRDDLGSFTLASTCVAAGAPVTGTATGFRPGETVDVYVAVLNSPTDLGAPFQTTVADASGNVAVSVTAPTFNGQYQVVVVGRRTGRFATASFTVQRNCTNLVLARRSSATGYGNFFGGTSPAKKGAVLVPGLGLAVFAVSKRRQRARDRDAA